MTDKCQNYMFALTARLTGIPLGNFICLKTYWKKIWQSKMVVKE